ncbi:MAG: hypothetical protein AAF456_13650 [Planctomycetota bacterium]
MTRDDCIRRLSLIRRVRTLARRFFYARIAESHSEAIQIDLPFAGQVAASSVEEPEFQVLGVRYRASLIKI